MAPRKPAAAAKKAPAAAAAVVELPPFEESEESKKMLEPWQKLITADSAESRSAAVEEVCSMIQTAGTSSFVTYKIEKRIQYAAVDSNNSARESSMVIISALLEKFGRGAEPFLIPLLPTVLSLYSDKLGPVKNAADAAGKALCSTVCPFAAKLMLPPLFEGMADRKNWRTAEAALLLMGVLSHNGPRQLGLCLPDIVPKVSEAMGDSKEQVKKAATDVMTDVCQSIGNKDIEQFIPALVSSIARPIEVPETVHKLSATTFVQTVTAPTLSIMVPLLNRGLRERAPAIKRKSAVITENMSKLIDDPLHAVPFLPKLLPALELVSKEAADPEIRTVASKAHKTLSIVGEEAEEILKNLLKPDEQVLFLLPCFTLPLSCLAALPCESGY
jgi:elongation factor 3